MDCMHAGFQEAVWPKIKSSLRQKLFELHRDGNIVIYVNDDGVEQAYWPDGTDCWRDDTWDGRRDCRVLPSIREHLEAYGTLSSMETGRNRRGAYVFTRDPERRRDEGEPPLMGRGDRSLSATSCDGPRPPSAVSDNDPPPLSAASDDNSPPPSELSGDSSRPPSDLSDDGLDADADSVMSDDPSPLSESLYSALSGDAPHGNWACLYSDDQVSPQDGYRHVLSLTAFYSSGRWPVSSRWRGSVGIRCL